MAAKIELGGGEANTDPAMAPLKHPWPTYPAILILLIYKLQNYVSDFFLREIKNYYFVFHEKNQQ